MANDESTDLQGYFRGLHTMSKRRWGFSVVLTVLAMFPVPVMVLVFDPSVRWLGVFIAFVFAVVGKWLGWWGGVIAGEGGEIQRIAEYHRGIGYPIDNKLVADKRAKYKGLDRLAKRLTIKNYWDDEGVTDDCGADGVAMAKLYMESSWWTGRLASVTSSVLIRAIAVVVVASCMMVVYSWAVGTSVREGIVGLVVCVMLAIDLMLLQRRYVSLERSADRVFEGLRNLLRGCEIASSRDVVLVAHNYLIDRSVGPPIPDWIYKRHRLRLNELWTKAPPVEWKRPSGDKSAT